jgi:hypothetical protein
MILETSQLLCSIYWVQGYCAPYKLTHKNHPCSIWVRESKANYLWLISLGFELCNEYYKRYGKIHKSLSVIKYCNENIDKLIFDKILLTEFVLVMPEYCILDNVYESYRYYYKKEKTFAKWDKINNTPYWY